jgi:polyisoprenoid-binding protein YceI
VTGPVDTAAPRRRRRPLTRWFAGSLLVMIAVVVAIAWVQYRSLVGDRRFQAVGFTVPSAPRLTALDGETVYRIDPSRSSIAYAVDERIVGQTASRATGSTNAISGDLAVNRADPGRSRVGRIIADVEQLHSDSSLRDARIRQGFLESHTFPLATFDTTALAGLPSTVVAGQTVSFTMTGRLEAHNRITPVVWNATATLGSELTATATTVVKMSSLGIGPISLAGLVTTGDDVTLTLHLVAVDPSRSTIPTLVAAPGSSPHLGGAGPSFKREVGPLLASSCASCHNSGQVGADHWVLDTAGDASKVADGIALVTTAKYMPPWPASSVGVPLAHSKALDAKAIDLLARWARAGGPLDVPASTRVRPAPAPEAAPAPRSDVVLRMPQSYTGSIENPNDYRCFVLDPGFTAPTYVTGYTVTPDQRQEIHHAQIFHISAAQAAEGSARSGEDGRPGWQCYAGPGLAGATPGSAGRGRRALGGQPGLIAGWVPGQDPVVYPQGSGVLFQPGDALVFQVHYHYDRAPTPDRSTVSLQTDPGGAPVRPLDIVNPLGPVEIPCLPGATAPLCDRSAALADDARLYGPAGSFIEPGLLLLCHKTPDELAAGFNGVASSSCDSRVPESGQIVATMGHMHTLGRSFRLTLDPGTPSARVLLDIPTWNFDWQMNYQLATPLHVTAGQTIRMECSWDRSLDPNRAPKYIVFAEGTEDEMCFSTYAMIPDAP